MNLLNKHPELDDTLYGYGEPTISNPSPRAYYFDMHSCIGYVYDGSTWIPVRDTYEKERELAKISSAKKGVVTALDRVDINVLTKYIKDHVGDVMEGFSFEPNDDLTRHNLEGITNIILTDLVNKCALKSFAIVCDESNNTEKTIDNNELILDVYIKPVGGQDKFQYGHLTWKMSPDEPSIIEKPVTEDEYSSAISDYDRAKKHVERM